MSDSSVSVGRLKEIVGIVKSDIARWSEVSGSKKTAPYPADSPCYYCALYEYNPDVCDYCINNAENRLLEIIDKDEQCIRSTEKID